MPASSDPFAINLLGDFSFFHTDEALELPDCAQRLLAYLALHEDGLARAQTAAQMWPEATDLDAAACLRTALWRLGPARAAVDASRTHIRLGPDVAVDLTDAKKSACALLDGSRAPLMIRGADRLIETLAKDLLPGWYDEWVLPEAERWRQLRLHALEALAEQLETRQDYARALLAAMTAVEGDPERESARAAVIRIHLAEGNTAEAVREFERFKRLVEEDLGLEPSPKLRALFGSKALEITLP